ncbi:MAG: TraC family protein [Candidatus Omnitrophica bacterium]|nr:TraC family protein [Candidatus Omnitrophota bacterium]
MALQITDIEKIFNEGPSLLDHLPYADEENGVFINVDGSLGRVWEVQPLGAEAVSAEILDSFSAQVAGILSRLSPRLCVQVMLWSDMDMGGAYDIYRAAGSAGRPPIVQAATDEKIRHFERVVGPRQLRVFLTVRYFPKFSIPSWPGRARGYVTGGITFAPDIDEMKKEREIFLKMIAPVENAFRSTGIALEVLGGKHLIRLLYRLLNPGRSLQVGINDREDAGAIRDQVLYNAPLAEGRGFVLDGYHTRVVTLKELPSKTWAGMFSCASGQGISLTDACKEFLMVLNFIVPDQSQAMGRLKFQKTFAFIQRTSSLGDISEEAVQKKEELSAVISESFKGGRAVVYARVHFIPFARSADEADRAADALINQLSRLGADGLKEEIIAPSLFLSCLPLNFDHSYDHFIRRTRRLLADNFSDMLPWYGAFRGTRTPAAVYLNRRGETVKLDFFDSEINPHAVIIGASGAGKSFLTNDLIYQNYRMGSYFFVLDKGNSYRKTCEILGGQYVSFEMDEPFCINPFFRKPNAENQAFLVEMLAMMASGGDERDRLSREERGLLQIAIQAAYEVNPDKEVMLSDVTAVLKDGLSCEDKGLPADTGRRLALRLTPFTRNGQYGKFFDGPNKLTSCGRFTVFELAQLSRYPDLQVVVLLNIMFFITNFVSESSVVAERKFLIIDEAWQLLKMSNTADFIANAFKTFRKYRCSAVAITQEAADLLQQKAGGAVMANTANKIFLKQDPSLIESFKIELSLSEEMAQLLRSLNTVKGQYSEALAITPSSSGVIRLLSDPFLYWAANSEPKNNEYLNTVREKLGGDLLAALKQCAKEYPYGIL